MEIKIALAYLLGLIVAQCVVNLATLTPNLPGDIYTILGVTSGQNFTVTLSITGTFVLTVYVKQLSGGTLTLYSLNSPPYTFTHTAIVTATHSIRVTSTYFQPIPYNLTINKGGVIATYNNFAVSYNYYKKLFYLNLSSCSNARVQSNDSSLFNAFNYLLPSMLPASHIDIGPYSIASSSNFSIILNETGTYGIIVQSNYPQDTYSVQSTPTIYINCYDVI